MALENVNGGTVMFNGGKPYHGSEAISGGKLTGATGLTDYFFFSCPRCNDGHKLRILDFVTRQGSAPKDRGEAKRPNQRINLAFHLYCPNCQFEDFVKLDNDHSTDPDAEPMMES